VSELWHDVEMVLGALAVGGGVVVVILILVDLLGRVI